MIRAVTFDLWETLIRDDAEVEERRRELRFDATCRALGRPVPRDDLYRAHDGVWRKLCERWARNEDVSIEEQAASYLELLGEKLDGARLRDFARAYAAVALEAPPNVDGSARAVLEALKRQGLRLGLICNTGRTPGWVLRILLEQFEIMGFLDAALFSDEELLRKPAPAIFRRALAGLGAEPAESVHVGDSESADVAGARAAGMRSIHLDGGVRLADVPSRIASMASGGQ